MWVHLHDFLSLFFGLFQYVIALFVNDCHRRNRNTVIWQCIIQLNRKTWMQVSDTSVVCISIIKANSKNNILNNFLRSISDTSQIGSKIKQLFNATELI